MRVPASLRPGDTVAVVAPSSGFEREPFERGLALLRGRYRVRLGDALFARAGYLAGDDDARLADLQGAIDDPAVRAIVAARGGYGATRLLDRLDLRPLETSGKWLVGFSDITALHAQWASAGWCSLHAPMVTSLADAPEAARGRWFDLLEGRPPGELRGLTALTDGVAEGRLVGGNLAVLCALSGTPFAPPVQDKVLLLEDVGERPYRVDRMLTSLRQAGWFARARGVLLGTFTGCTPGPDGVTVEEVLQEHLAGLTIPVLAGVRAGHVSDNHPLPLGAAVRLDASAGAAVFSWP